MKALWCWFFHRFIPMQVGIRHYTTVALWNRGRTYSCNICERTWHESD